MSEQTTATDQTKGESIAAALAAQPNAAVAKLTIAKDGGDDPLKIVEADRRHWHCRYELTGPGVPPYRVNMAIQHNASPAYLYQLHPCAQPGFPPKRAAAYNKMTISHTDKFWRPKDQPPEVFNKDADGNWVADESIQQAAQA